MIFNTIISSLQQGLCYALVAMGVYISYKILDFPDLTVDGTFPLGAVVTVSLIRGGTHPIFAIIAAVLSGMLAGMITGLLHVKLKISKLLSGILTMTGLLSIVLNLGKINKNVSTFISYEKFSHIFNNGFINLFPTKFKNVAFLIVLICIVLIVKILLDMFFKTKQGMLLCATGDNEQLVTSLGKNSGTMKILGLSLSNGIVALGGCIFSQLMGFYDNSSGVGMIVLTLSSVIIGIAIFKNFKRVKGTSAVIIGAIIYMLCLTFIINIGLDSTYLKLVMAVLFILILIINNILLKNSLKLK